MNTANLEHYQQEFSRVQPTLAGNDLPWLNALREDALKQFIAQGFPTFHEEDWKYTNVSPIAKRNFALSGGTSTIPGLTFENFDAYRLVFIDGHFCEKNSCLPESSPTLQISSIKKQLAAHPETLKNYLSQTHQQSTHLFTPLNTAFFNDGAYIKISAETKIEKPIHLIFISSGEHELNFAPLRNIMIAEKNSHAIVIEQYISLKINPAFTNTYTDIFLAESAKLEHYKLLQENEKNYYIGNVFVTQEAQSQFHSHSFALGGAIVRSDIQVDLAAEHTTCHLNGLYLLNDHQHVDHHTLINHAKPHGSSKEYYKGVISDKGRAVFNGKVIVHPDAQKTDAQQSNKNLLLSEDAEIDTKPQLEIFADDVKCTHGATVGQLDEDALFYLRSRGLDEKTARNILIYAFAKEIIERVTLKPLRLQLEKEMEKRLSTALADERLP